MKAVVCERLGPPETLVIKELDPPTAAAGEVVISVKAAALNFFDTLIIEGKYQYRPDCPFSPGAEIAGIIKSAGPDVTELAKGDRVMAYLGWGGARQEVVVPVDRVVKLPDGVTDEAAAGLTVTYGTTIYALKDRAALQPGETLAVLGASGGVGQAAIEIGKIMGARVIACASSEEKLEFCRELGADDTINYAETDLKTALKEATGGKGVDVVYDPVGGPLAEQALRATGWNGRFLVIGFASGNIPKLPLNLVLLKGCQVVGVFWGDHTQREPDKHRANMATLLDWCRSGKIKPYIYKTYALEETVDALQDLAERRVKGKTIIVP
ncbi:MAG: NADPH:quinone oxidoreductase family protein [Hyphomicrobiales bacterium]|nr:NADPH:quinone oxidoreductase family protein [Hyphomicrobiales bacterium]